MQNVPMTDKRKELDMLLYKRKGMETMRRRGQLMCLYDDSPNLCGGGVRWMRMLHKLCSDIKEVLSYYGVDADEAISLWMDIEEYNNGE